MIRLLLSLVLLLPVPALAASRTYSVGSYDRVRVDGPFEVRIRTGASPNARAEGDQRLLNQLDIAVNGNTLVVHLSGNGWGETPANAQPAAPVVTLSTPRLTAIAVNSGGRVTVAPLIAQRIDVSVLGTGAITAQGIAADEFNVTVAGSGQVTLAGRTQRARLAANGPGTIAAGQLVANDLVIRLDGVGQIDANARFTAQVSSTGLGKVTVAGGAKCTVKAQAGGPVACGAKPAS